MCLPRVAAHILTPVRPLQRHPLSQVLVAFGVLVLGFLYFSLWILDGTVRLNQLGLFCSVFTIGMYLSPLADLVSVPSLFLRTSGRSLNPGTHWLSLP